MAGSASNDLAEPEESLSEGKSRRTVASRKNSHTSSKASEKSNSSNKSRDGETVEPDVDEVASKHDGMIVSQSLNPY